MLILSETYRRTVGELSETDMPDWRPIEDLDMLHRRPICFIGDPLETDMLHRKPTCLRSLNGILTQFNILIFIYFLLIYIHVGLRWVVNQACQYPMGHISFRWVSD